MDIGTFLIEALKPEEERTPEFDAVLAGWQAYIDKRQLTKSEEQQKEFYSILSARVSKKDFRVDAPNRWFTAYKCSICGKLTTGRKMLDERRTRMFYAPRKHKDASGLMCYGVNREAIMVDVEEI